MYIFGIDVELGRIPNRFELKHFFLCLGIAEAILDAHTAFHKDVQQQNKFKN